MRRELTFKAKIGLIALAVAIFICAAAKASKMKPVDYEAHCVARGETLWGIVKEYNPEAENVDAVLYEMKRRNCMKTSVIYVGDVIDVPVMGR